MSAHPLTEQFKSKTELTITLTLTQSSIISSASIDPLSFSLIHPQFPPPLSSRLLLSPLLPFNLLSAVTKQNNYEPNTCSNMVDSMCNIHKHVLSGMKFRFISWVRRGVFICLLHFRFSAQVSIKS